MSELVSCVYIRRYFFTFHIKYLYIFRNIKRTRADKLQSFTVTDFQFKNNFDLVSGHRISVISDFSKNEIGKVTKPGKLGRWLMKKKCWRERQIERPHESKTQLLAFQKAMKLLLVAGQWLGLNPITGILETDLSKMRLSLLNWKSMYSVMIWILQTTATIFNINRMYVNNLAISDIGTTTFYLTASMTTFTFLCLGRKWSKLMKELSQTHLNEFVDPSITSKCYVTCVVGFILSIAEHMLSLLPKISRITHRTGGDAYAEFLNVSYAWYYELGLPGGKAMGIFMQVINTISTLTWNYLDVYIICVSMYLVSILGKINKKVIYTSKKFYVPPISWKALREDYNSAAQLVRSFDDVISGVVFTSFASNLFFICLQIYNIFAYSFKKLPRQRAQYNNGLFSENIMTIYLGYSTLFMFARSLAMSLTAANVHSESLLPANALYNVPATSFCPEVERFLQQVQSNRVALSGLQFFYVRRGLVLSMAGTVVTYELVLLQIGEN